MNIVFDKNILIGATHTEIQYLLSKHRLLMSETLFMEILTADDKTHIKKCFGKLDQKENPVDLLPTSSNLICFEKTQHKCCTPLTDHILRGRYEFNEKLRTDKNTTLLEKVEGHLDKWDNEITEGTNRFIEAAIIVNGWFPAIKDKTKITKEEKDSAIEKVSIDDAFIRNIYAEMQKTILENEGEEWPASQKINKHWAIFRYLQFHLVAAIDHLWRYGVETKKISKKKINNYIDLDYCILGSLADGLATRDNLLIEMFKAICPEKLLIS